MELRLLPGASLKSGCKFLVSGGCLLQGAPGKHDSQPVHTRPTPESPSWPCAVWRGCRPFHLLAPAKCGALAQPGPSLPCPKGHHPEVLALLGTLRAPPGMQGCRQGRGGVPTGRGTGLSGSPGVPSHAGDSQGVWAAGKQAFSVSAAHPALKHVPSVSWRVGPVSHPSGPSDHRATHPPTPATSHPPLLCISIPPLCHQGGGAPPGLGVGQMGLDLKGAVHPSLGGAWGSLWLLPPSPSIPCPLRNEPHGPRAKLKILTHKLPPCGCCCRAGSQEGGELGWGWLPLLHPNPSSPHPYTLASGTPCTHPDSRAVAMSSEPQIQSMV